MYIEITGAMEEHAYNNDIMSVLTSPRNPRRC
jgi:hypothetical protein